MGKLFGYTLAAVTIIVTLQIFGIEVGLRTYLDFFGINIGPEKSIINLTDSGFSKFINDNIFTILGAGLAIGLLTRGKPENIVVYTIASAVLFQLIGVYTGLIAYSSSAGLPFWLQAIYTVIFLPIAFGMLFSLVEFLRGTD